MKHWWEDLKKIGAGLTIVLLAIMMTLMFSGQPIDEITSLLAGRGGAAGFDGQSIPLSTYGEIDGRCRDRIRSMLGGEAPDYFVRQCVTGTMKELYVLPKIGTELGLEVSEDRIQEQMVEMARAQYLAQGETVHADDRLSMQEIYNRLVAQNSVEMQKRGEMADRVRKSLSEDFPRPVALARSGELTGEIKLRLRLVRYTGGDLLEKVGGNVEIPDDEIRLAFEKEQQNVPEDKRKNYENERKFVKNRLLQDRKQTELSDIKKRLGELKGESGLEEVAKITGVRIQSVGEVALSDLTQVSPGDGSSKLNLAIPGFLLDLGKKGDVIFSGPHQVGESTVYAEVTGIRVPEKFAQTAARETAREKLEAAVDRSAGRRGEEAGQIGPTLFQYMVDQTSERGRFEIYINPTPAGQ